MERQPNDSKLEVRLPADLAAAAKEKAAKENRPVSQVVRDLLRAWIAGTANG